MTDSLWTDYSTRKQRMTRHIINLRPYVKPMMYSIALAPLLYTLLVAYMIVT